MTQGERAILQYAQSLDHWVAQKTYYHTACKNKRVMVVKRGEVYFADLGLNIGSEENKIRPVVVIQADSYNFSSPVFIGAIISSSGITIPDIQVPITGNYPYTDEKGNTRSLSGAIDLGQIRTIAKERIVTNKICDLSVAELKEVGEKIYNIFGLVNEIKKRDNIIASLQGKIEYYKQKLGIDN